MVARFRRSRMVGKQRIKHVIDSSATSGAGGVFKIPLVAAKDSPVLANTVEVETGSQVNGIYAKIEVASNEVQDVGAIPNAYLMFYKNPGGNLTMPQPNAVGASDNKRYIFHQEMVMIENTGKGGNARILFNGVVAVPKGYARMGPNDEINVDVYSPAMDMAVCLQAHYKEFR